MQLMRGTGDADNITQSHSYSQAIQQNFKVEDTHGYALNNDVAVNNPLLELNVKLEPLLGGKSPVAAVVNNGKQVVSLDSSATVTAVPTEARATAISPVPSKLVPPIVLALSKVVAVEALPVKAPVNPVDVNIPVEGL